MIAIPIYLPIVLRNQEMDFSRLKPVGKIFQAWLATAISSASTGCMAILMPVDWMEDRHCWSQAIEAQKFLWPTCMFVGPE